MDKEMMEKNSAEYAEEFAAPDAPKSEQTEDEAFGLGPEAAAEPAAEAEPEAAAEDAPAGEPVAEVEADAAPAAADPEQRLKSWEGRLKAKQMELDAREASMGSSSANEEQMSMDMGEEGESAMEEAGESPAMEAGEDSDPARMLAEDFGQDFVDQLKSLVMSMVDSGVGGVNSTVTQLIADLQQQGQQNHFQAIADTHGDFMEVVESPEFSSWKESQPDQGALQEVIDTGSSRQIIAMLTKYKDHCKGMGDGMGSSDDDALDAAEGVRSSGISLPKEPTSSQDFADAWNEA